MFHEQELTIELVRGARACAAPALITAMTKDAISLVDKQ